MPVPHKHTPPHQTHTPFKKRTGQAVAIGCWARPEKDTAWQPTYLQPALFIPNFSPFSPKCSSLTHLDDSFPFRSSPWTSPFSWAHSLFLHALLPGTPRGAGVSLTVLQGCRTWDLFFLFPTADHIPKEHQGTIWLCSTPKVAHKNAAFNERKAQL